MNCLHFVVRGRVQRVGFRRFVAALAVELAVVGWVRNEPDGSVTGTVEGDESALAEFVAGLRRGPALAIVDSVDCARAEPSGARTFAVR